jgi:hypothetical protein
MRTRTGSPTPSRKLREATLAALLLCSVFIGCDTNPKPSRSSAPKTVQDAQLSVFPPDEAPPNPTLPNPPTAAPNDVAKNESKPSRNLPALRPANSLRDRDRLIQKLQEDSGKMAERLETLKSEYNELVTDFKLDLYNLNTANAALDVSFKAIYANSDNIKEAERKELFDTKSRLEEKQRKLDEANSLAKKKVEDLHTKVHDLMKEMKKRRLDMGTLEAELEEKSATLQILDAEKGFAIPQATASN